jgi:hypothetical protein
MPQIWHQPKYPGLKHNSRADSGGNRGMKSSKYYSQYREKWLTGGIMAAWCSHSVCYSFHCIPKGKGCNDVFSAMYTCWKTPPKSSSMTSPACSGHIACHRSLSTLPRHCSLSTYSIQVATQNVHLLVSYKHTPR